MLKNWEWTTYVATVVTDRWKQRNARISKVEIQKLLMHHKKHFKSVTKYNLYHKQGLLVVFECYLAFLM